MKRLLPAAAALALAAAMPVQADAAARRLTIVTGGVTGVYYNAGKAICALMNAEMKKTNIRCVAETSRGSAANVAMLRSGKAEIAIMQGDAQWHAYRGTGVFAAVGPDRGLTGALRLHREVFTVLVRRDSDIASFAELRASLFGLGGELAGPRVTVRQLAGVLGWKPDQPRVASGLRSRDLGRALCDRLVDAIAVTVGHPSHVVQEPVSTCGARIVPVLGDAVDRMVAAAPYYEPAVVPKKAYELADGDLPSFATRAVVVAASHVPANVVYEMVRLVMRRPAALGKAHPALVGLTPAEMRPRARISPVHEGAARYFRERDKR
jgi:TRAP transporter TAXI family solute receptor